MKKSNIFWGIVLIIGAVGLIVHMVAPELSLFSISLWKWFLAALLVWWLVSSIVDAKTWVNRVDVFFPVCLGVALFHDELGLGEVPIWTIILVGALLHVALHLLFPENMARRKTSQSSSEKSYSESEQPVANESRFADTDVYLDATKSHHIVKNSFGQMRVHFQNLDVVNAPETIEIEIDNSFGQMTLIVPHDWDVKCDVVNNIGGLEIRNNETSTLRTVHLTGETRFGNLTVES